MAEQPKETKAERTARVGTRRGQAVLDSFRLFGNLGASNYELTPAQIDAAEQAFAQAFKDCFARLRGTKATAEGFTL